MKKKILQSMCLLSILTVLLSSVFIFFVMYREFYDQMKQDVRLESVYIADKLNQNDISYLEHIPFYSRANRITLIQSDGSVLFDSDFSVNILESHLDRPEVQSALHSGEGEAFRFSSTNGSMTFYRAILLDNGAILRISNTITSIYDTLLTCIPYIVLVSIMITAICIAVATYLTNKIIYPINCINLTDPMKEPVYEELSPLLSRISRQNNQITKHLQELKKHQEEFGAITENMEEGLIILNASAHVLSINHAALSMFQIDTPPQSSQHIMTLIRDISIRDIVEEALQGHSCERILFIQASQYQVLASPVRSEQTISGAVLLLLDVTERQKSEQMRREFSANVSHELKTPLQSISGFAEIIQNGLVKEEDIPRFAGRIHAESVRLISLIEDIIKLSRLDEGEVALEKEKVDLFLLTEEISQQLLSIIEEKHLTFSLLGSSTVITGSKRILTEVIYNLLENAVKYNRDNGSITVTIAQQPQSISFRVADTGIGIPLEHQSRVFERFYRVDKSHSKATGGTGLGLSIVKHGVIYHHAQIALESTPDVGTTITLTFFPDALPQ